MLIYMITLCQMITNSSWPGNGTVHETEDPWTMFMKIMIPENHDSWWIVHECEMA